MLRLLTSESHNRTDLNVRARRDGDLHPSFPEPDRESSPGLSWHYVYFFVCKLSRIIWSAKKKSLLFPHGAVQRRSSDMRFCYEQWDFLDVISLKCIIFLLSLLLFIYFSIFLNCNLNVMSNMWAVTGADGPVYQGDAVRGTPSSPSSSPPPSLHQLWRINTCRNKYAGRVKLSMMICILSVSFQDIVCFIPMKATV